MTYIPVNQTSPPTLTKNVIDIDNFKGVDLTQSPTNVADYRSPEAPNMIRDTPGKVRKRMGFHTVKTYTDKINGVFFLKKSETSTVKLVHAGTNLYEDATQKLLYSSMKNDISQSWQIGGKLFIVDGKKMLVYSKEEDETSYSVKTAESIAYVPTLMATTTPDGVGRDLEYPNLLGSKFTISYAGEAGVEDYYLPYDDLDDTEVEVETLNGEGDWVKLTEDTDFTVNRTLGKITFKNAPGVSPAGYTDNVHITASRDWGDYKSRINYCTVSILYGVNGSANQLFLTGNYKFINYDWHSEVNNPLYFADIWYDTIGQDSSSIIGYSIVSDYLAAHKDEGEDGRNIILRRGTLGSDNDISFPVVNSIQGQGAIGKRNFAYLNENLFVTKLGVYAITAQDITGEKYTQSRSFYIDKALQEEDLENSFALVYRDYYVLAVPSGRLYFLDGLQKTYEKNAPLSSFQYECYYAEGIDARVLYRENDTLCFGTANGELMEFYIDAEDPASYNDNGKAIAARWDMPDISGKLFYKNKTFRYMSVRLASAIATGFELWAQSRGLWRKYYDASARARYWDFSYIDFSLINFSSDSTPRTIGSKVKIKKVDKARFSIRNEKLNEPFGIYNVAFEYTQSGNYKG